MRLTDEELRRVLARAEEIERTSRQGDAWNTEVAAVIGAGEEVGLSRQAIERALAESHPAPAPPPAVGSLAWARSADGKFYVAEVMFLAEDGARVRFLQGSEHRVAMDELRPCAFIPGEKVFVHWPMWGPWNCTVINYDAVKQRLTLSDGWAETKVFPVSKVWLPPAKADPKSAGRRVAVRLLGAGAAAGAVIGSIITAILLR